MAYNDGVIPGKPDPSIFLLAAKRAGAKKIVVVDSMKNNYAEKNNMLVIKDFREIERLIQFINS